MGIEIPPNFFGMVCSRSGLALKYGVVVLNAPGVIDSDYRGEIRCIMINHSKNPFVVENEMRIAQLVVLPFQTIEMLETHHLTETKRGQGGFGSTGVM
jgi:dUTP pyrophosphatase